MEENLKRLICTRKTGKEMFHLNGEDTGFDLLSFWEWSASDLVSNATRGRVAEYIVAQALGLASGKVRDEWAAFDLQTPSGVKIEVKSGAYIQAWHQDRYSSIMFRVPPRLAWDPDCNKQSREARRQADVYVFAVLAHRDKPTIDPLNIAQWQFYALPTTVLDARSQYGITLPSLKKLCGDALQYADLAKAVEKAAGRPLI